jgi:hypothetical protein
VHSPQAFLDKKAVKLLTLKSLSVCTSLQLQLNDLIQFLGSLGSIEENNSRKFSLFVTLDNREFSWDAGPQNAGMANFIGVLVHHVRVPKKKGIEIFD